MMAERGVDLAHTTIMRWVQRYVPECERRWDRFARKTGRSWRVDETYVKIKGRWTYLYRAVDSEGKTVDFLSRTKARCRRGESLLPAGVPKNPGQIAPRDHARWLPGVAPGCQGASRRTSARSTGTVLRSSKYLKNLIEQDHRSVKLRLGPMLGFKRFGNASTTIAGIELMHRIRKGQFNVSKASRQ